MEIVCISPTTSKKFGKEFGVDESIMSTWLKEWTMQRIAQGKPYALSNKKEDANRKSVEKFLNQKLCRTKLYYEDKETYEQAHEAWQIAMDQIANAGNISEKQWRIALNKCIEAFGNDSVVLYVNDKGERIISIKEPALKGQSFSNVKVEIHKGYWTRDEVAKQTDKVFLFGDNTNDRVNTHYVPHATQAVIRGLDNAIGIDTKKNRGTSADSYFTDADFDAFKAQVDEAIQTALNMGKTIVIPADGIGTGKAELEKRAPKLFEYLQNKLEELKNMQTETESEEDEETDLAENYEVENSFDVGSRIVKQLKKDAKNIRKVEKDENGNPVHYYEIKQGNTWKRVDTSVTQLVHGQKDIDPMWSVPSTTIGNSADLAVREYFEGKDITDGHLPNFTKRQAQDLAEDLEKLTKYFDETFGKDQYRVITEEIPIVGTFAEVENGKTVYKTVAGTMDMLVYTKSVDFYIFDMKTKRTNTSTELGSDKLSAYAKQVSYYRSILEANYPQLRGKIKGLHLIQLDVMYPDPVKDPTVIYTAENNGELLVSGKPIKDNDSYSSPRLHNTGLGQFEAIIPVDYQDAIKKIEALKDIEEYSDADYLTRTKPLKQAQKDRQIAIEKQAKDTKNKKKKAWRDCTLITPSQKLYLSNLAMNLASDIVSELQKKESANNKYFPDGEYKNVDFTKWARQQIIEELGVRRLFNLVRDTYYDSDLAQLRGVEDENILNAFDVAYDNFEALIEDSYARFILLEKYSIVSLKSNDNETITEEGYDEQISAEQEQLEEKEREYYQLGFRQISAKAGLSSEMRRFFEHLRLPEDDSTFKLPRFVDSDVAINSILDWCKDCATLEDMEKVLEEMSEMDSNSWIKQLLPHLKEEPFRSKFFNNFRKDFSQYSISFVDYNRNGKMVVKTKTINTKSAIQTLLDGLVASFKEGRVSNLIYTTDTLEGRGYVIKSGLDQVKQLHNEIEKTLKTAFTSIDKRQYRRTMVAQGEELSKLLSKLGLSIKKDILANILLRDGKKKNWDTTNAYNLLLNIDYIIKDLEKHTNTNEMYSPVSDDEDEGVYNNYKNIASIVSPLLQDGIESCTYQNGKMYYSFTVPSYLQGMVKSLQNAQGRFDDYVEENYKFDTFFYIERDGKKIPLNGWLDMLENSRAAKQVIDHKVQLSYDGTEYRELSELGYTLSLMSEFFYDRNKKLAWYRAPIFSNKPSSEFIRFYRFAGSRYKEQLLRRFEDVCIQEIIRIQSVLQAAANNLDNEITQPIANFNITISKKDSSEFKSSLQNILQKVKDKKELTHEDLVKNGKWLLSTGKNANGASFKFLSDLNEELIQNTELGQAILAKINAGITGKNVPADVENKFNEGFKLNNKFETLMDARTSDEIKQWRELGLFDTVEKEVKDKDGNKRTEVKYKYVDYLHQISWNTAYEEAKKNLSKDASEEEIVKAAKEIIEEEIENNLENYVWNDAYATIEIIQLSATDIAYYKNMEDFQKRIAQLHSPTMKLNKTAYIPGRTDGKMFSKDGKCRTIFIKDYEIISEIIPNVEAIFNAKIKAATNKQEQIELEKLKKEIVGAFKKINVTDGQAYNSITSYMKKLSMVGKWDDTMMEAYNRIVKDKNWNINDLAILWTSFKPFVYTQTKKTTGTQARPEEKVPLQIKNSEYLLLLGEALLRSGNQKTTLNAIFDFMEDTAYDGKTHNFDTYNGIGIDCVAFGSNVKSGLQGEIDVYKYGQNYKGVLKALNEAAYYNKDHTGSADNNGDRYDDQFVATFDFDDYGFQQEVPAHLVDHEQLVGSQQRILSISDFTPSQLGQQLGKLGITVEQGIKEYQELTAKNIRKSYDKLIEDLKLNGSPREKREALADLLYQEICKDQRYGGDLLYACQLDDNGEFNIPLNDPIQSVRIQQLLNSIIKSRINKQKVSGGPVVQTTSFGISKQLHIRFAKENGKPLDTYEEFCTKNELKYYDDESRAKFDRYVEDNQGRLDHLEIMIPVPSTELKEALTKKDGSLMSVEEAVKKGIIKEDFLKAICYRIPTEDKYSIMPCKIVGFLSSAEEAIMMPEEITCLTGSDFDIDKMYIMLQTLFQDDKGKFHLSNRGRDKTNNRIFELQYELLRHSATMEKMFNPQSFDAQKKAARIVTLLENGYKYSDIKNKSLSELNDLTSGIGESHNIIFSTSQVYFHKQNMTAGKLIGIFANNNTSHAFLSMPEQDIRLNLTEEGEFTFAGITIKDNTKVDAILAKDGYTLISKNIAGFLAASVDAVKDPVLNFINLNTATSGAAMVLARLGFDPESIGLFLSQPLIKEVVREYFKRNNEGYISLEDLIQKILYSDRFKVLDIETIEADLKNSSFSKEEMANGIFKQDTDSEEQVRALLLLKKLAGMSRDLGTLTFLTKFNSVSNAPGPMISDALVMEDRRERFFKSIIGIDGTLLPTATFKESALYVIDNSPILKAFYDCTIGPENGVVKKIFKEYFPHYTAKFEESLRMLRQFTKSSLDSDTIDRYVNFFTLYKLSMTDFLKGEKTIVENGVERPMTADEVRNWYIKEFPRHYGTIVSELGLQDNELIKLITYNGKTKKCPIPTLTAKTGSLSIDSQEKIKAGWTELMQSSDKRIQELGRDLFIYNIYRNGFMFSPKTFLNLASTDVKLSSLIAEGYTDFMRDPTNGDEAVDEFNLMVQFMRNYSHSKKLVPEVQASKKLRITKAKDINGKQIITLTSQTVNKPMLGMEPVITEKDKGRFYAAPVIQYDGDIYVRYDNSAIDSRKPYATYVLSSSLGVQNEFLEVNGNAESGLEMTSVLNQKSIERSNTKTEAPSAPSNTGNSETGESSETKAVVPSLTEDEMNFINNIFSENKYLRDRFVSSSTDEPGFSEGQLQVFKELNLGPEYQKRLQEIIKKMNICSKIKLK